MKRPSPARAGLLGLAALAALAGSALANHSQPTLVVVSGREAVRGSERACFTINSNDGSSDAITVRLRFRGDVPSGRVVLDGQRSREFAYTSETFTFRVDPRGVHQLALDLDQATVLDYMSITSAGSGLEQVPCSDYVHQQDRHVEVSGEDAELIDGLEAGDGSSRDWYEAGGSGSQDRSVAALGAIIPAGTQLDLVLDDTLSTETARVGQQVSTRLARSIVIGGKTALPSGSQVLGTIGRSQKAGRFGRAELALRFVKVILPGGSSVAINAMVQELGRGSAGKQTGIIIGSAVGGAVVGKAVGGDSRDAILGALLGGGIAAGSIAAKPGRPVILSAGTVLLVRLETSARMPDRLASSHSRR